MPLKKKMEYLNRPPIERGPHQIAVAMATVLERFAAIMEQRLRAAGVTATAGRFDVGEHPELEDALLKAGEQILLGTSPNPPIGGRAS